jgi:glycosyltransferase involved in cell wall biosynthesis
MIAKRDIPRAALAARSAGLLARSLIWAPAAIREFRRRRKRSERFRRAWFRRSRVLFSYSQVVWQEVWQRPQEIALGLADYLPVVFMSPLQVHRLYDSVPDWRRDFRVERGHGVRVVQPLILPGEYKSRLIFALNRRLIWAEVCAVLPPESDILFLSNSPFSADLLGRLDWARRVYDLIDDFPGFQWAPPDARQMEERWLAEADIVLSGSQALQERHRARRPDIEFIPSGVRFERFNSVPAEVPEDIRSLPRPILGYIGSVSGRLDRQLLEQLCREVAEGSVVLIGPIHGSFDAPRDIHNLHLLGPRSHEMLPAYVHRFDLALLPFAMTEATQAINPVKTLEYLAAGRIVISTPVPDVVRFFLNEVIVARDRDEFVHMARHWLTADSEALRSRGIERARQSLWDDTVRCFARRMGLIPAACGSEASGTADERG